MSVTEMHGTEMSCTVRENYAWQDDILLIAQERETELDNRRMNVICYHFDIDLSELREWLATKRKRKTNADRIRSMTDEELDKFLGEVQWDVANYCGGVTQKQEYPVPEQMGAWLDWLKKEVEDG